MSVTRNLRIALTVALCFPSFYMLAQSVRNEQKDSLLIFNDISYSNSSQENRYLTGSSDNQITIPQISFIDSFAVVIEYPSVYDVHNIPDQVNYPNMRAQPGYFDTERILSDLEKEIEPSYYDFILLYSLIEIPGWINSGMNYGRPAKNIGFSNSGASADSHGFSNWSRLRSVPPYEFRRVLQQRRE